MSDLFKWDSGQEGEREFLDEDNMASNSATAVASQQSIKAYVDNQTIPWTDYSATSTITGWTSFTTKKIYYKKIGKLVFVTFHLDGTSNSTSTNFTLPYTSNSAVQYDAFFQGKDNSGANFVGLLELLGNSSTANLYSTPGGGAWTASGTKQVRGQFWFEAAS